jgi:hypothetical protein
VDTTEDEDDDEDEDEEDAEVVCALVTRRRSDNAFNKSTYWVNAIRLSFRNSPL